MNRTSVGALVVACFAPAAFAQPAAGQDSGYTPHRVYHVASARFADFESLAAAAAAVDVVYFGELHGNEPGHRMQHALLEALQRRGGGSLSLEMFERDVAPLLQAYVAGDTAEAALLEHGRPWPRYVSDYRPLVEHARAHGWTAVAANAPRSLANRVAREGLDAVLADLDEAGRALLASDIQCPDDAYRDRFVAEMQRHPMGPPGEPAEEAAREQRFYEAQCLKDETMAAAIAAALDAGVPTPLVHVTGAFHSDHGDGVPVRVTRRRPAATALSIALVPVADLDDVDPAPHLERADFLLFTLRPAAAAPDAEP